MDAFDVVVIGGGAAGLSAALVLTRARRRVLVVDAGSPRNAPAVHMHGFLSRDGFPPRELLEIGREEVAAYGGRFVDDDVDGVAPADDGFRLVLRRGAPVTARQVLVATGLRDELPEIPGLRERWAKDVLHCPYCHGYEVKDLRLGVLGGSPQAVRYAQIVRQWTDDLVYFTATGMLSDEERRDLDARSIVVAEGAVKRILVADDRLCGVELDGERTVARDALFVPPRFVPNSDLLVALGCEHDRDGWPVMYGEGRTSVPGVWAAGNVANARAQVVTAAGEGSATAIAINAELVDGDIRNALAGPNYTNKEHV